MNRASSGIGRTTAERLARSERHVRYWPKADTKAD